MGRIEEVAAGLENYLKKHLGELFAAATWSPRTPGIYFRMGIITQPYIKILHATRKAKSGKEGNESTHDLTVGVSSLDRTSSESGKPATSQSGFYQDKISLVTPFYAELGNPDGLQNISHTALPKLKKGAVGLTELWFEAKSPRFFPVDFANLGLYSNATVNSIHRVVAFGTDNVTDWFYNQARFGSVADNFTRERRLKDQQDEIAEDLKTAEFAKQNPEFPPFHPKPIDEYYKEPFLIADFNNMKGALTGSYELPEELQNVLEALRQRTVSALRERLELSEKANPNHRGRLEKAINPMLLQARVLGLDKPAGNYRLVFMGEEIPVSEFIQSNLKLSTPEPPATVGIYPRPRNYNLYLKRYRG